MFKTCDCCWETLAQDHHILSIATFKDSKIILPLCANCHQVFHLIEIANRHGELWSEEPKTKAGKLILAYRNESASKTYRFRYLVNLLNFSIELTEQFRAMQNDIAYRLKLDYLRYLENTGWCIIPPRNWVTEQWAELEIDGSKLGTEFLELLKRFVADDPPVDQIRNEAAILLKKLSGSGWES